MENIIVTSFDHKYLRLGLALISSIWENSKICSEIYILDSGIKKKDIVVIKKWAIRKSKKINIVKVYPELFKRYLGQDVIVPINFQYYSRLLIPYLVPKECKRILYLDSDIICVSDLKSIFKINLDGKIIACCQDFNFNYFSSLVGKQGKYQVIQNCRDIGFSGQEKYFNSGVLLIDTAEWIRNNISRSVLNFTSIYSEYVFLWDQYGLNIVLNNKWKQLGNEWNEMSKIEPGVTVFRHFIKVKPISNFFTGFDLDYFLNFLDMTPLKKWRPSKFNYFVENIILKFNKVKWFIKNILSLS